ncbi:MAG TPA: NAD(P)/FAD-dependent oxidoreductase [Methylomirabilota bacterium]|jgi:flavin-dependent dehydrogenase|nr:NAD(P)/FAD-dependent oxidoreductase [Methylomirabilota bacterium]
MTRAADVVVVGAGPAGAATAILLAEHGLAVTVLERGRRTRPKICGEYLSPEAGRLLDRLGALKAVDAGGATALYGMRITAPDGTVLDGRYGPVGAYRPYVGHALGVARATLDGALLDRVRALPVDLREGVRVTDVLVEGGQVAGVRGVDENGAAVEARARVVVAADGRASVIAHRLGCRQAHRLARMALVTYVADVPECRDVGEIFVDPPDYAILNPLAPERVNLSLVVPLAHAVPWRARLEDFFAARVKHLPHLARRLAGARRVAPLATLGPLAYRVTPPREGGVLFAGDAAGFYDPFTGEGIFTALRSAELAAETLLAALRAGDVSAAALDAYRRARRAAFADKERVTRGLQALIAHRRLANLAARWMAARPRVLGALLGVIGDYVPPRALPRLLLS